MAVIIDAAALKFPVAHVARDYAQRQIQSVNATLTRLHDASDVEALHDFRVELRRLRSWIRAYNEFLGVNSKSYKRIGRLAQVTNVARDAEVGLQYLNSIKKGLQIAEKRGLAWLALELESASRDGVERAQKEVTNNWHKIADQITAQLASAGVAAAKTRETFGEHAAKLLDQHITRLTQRINAVNSDGEFHKVRIAGKRLRYLVEPLRKDVPQVKQLVQVAKQMQDLLGELNDAQVLYERLQQSVFAAGKEQAMKLLAIYTDDKDLDEEKLRVLRHADPVKGLLNLTRLLKNRRDDLVVSVRQQLPDIMNQITLIADELIAQLIEKELQVAEER
ncbi:MAG: CHAD domain-containing protein [Gammaproteobacteria bacterium]|nr:CHAD domain-containing protein [Gammaproteobacteria bacterium]